MYSLLLRCAAEQVDALSGELWEAGTAGIQESGNGEAVVLSAGFETNDRRLELLERFAAYSPEWIRQPEIDWVARTHLAWPARAISERLFLAPHWSEDPTPEGRQRIVHNPGLACGTGDHPCTQLALEALERCVAAGSRVIDVGTGSGILAIAALRLSAAMAAGIDPDAEALEYAKENFALNRFKPLLVAGYADCVRDGSADVTVANISATVLLDSADDLLRVTAPGGRLILTGFTEAELARVAGVFGEGEALASGEWRCLILQTS